MTAVDDRPTRRRGALGTCAGPCGRVIAAEGTPREQRPEGSAERRGRGCCGTCYAGATKDGTLADYPRVNRSAEDFLEDWAWLRDEEGATREEAAARLGYSSLESFERVLLRLRRDRPDDPRTAPGVKRRVPLLGLNRDDRGRWAPAGDR